jgi:hypothetical protein
MSDNAIALLQQGASQLPAAIRAQMESMTSSELQANVGASFAVMSIKGKSFSIKFGGQTTLLVMEAGGQQYPAQFFDCVIPIAKAELSKTWYKGTYSEGDDGQPDCYSEDGIHPLAPMQQRPLVNGSPCIDCRVCPNNIFGSKVSDNGSRGKACSDTRKVLVLPIDSRTGLLDAHNVKFGGPMLLRIPPASLRVLGDYDAKLNHMGASYIGVVTRIEFDPTVAFPKLVFKALRYLSDAEAADVLEVRNGLQARQILESGQTGAAPQAPDPSVAQLTGPMPVAQPAPTNVVPIHAAPQPAPVAVANPTPVAPAPAPTPVAPAPVAAAPAPVAPVPAPVAPPVPVAAPVAPAFPPAGWQAHPTAPGYFHDGVQAISEAELRLRMQAAAAPAAPPVPAIPAAAVAAAPAPSDAVAVTPQMMASVDNMLAGLQ